MLAVLFGVLFSLYEGLNALIGMRSGGSTLAAWKPFLFESSSILVIVALIPFILRFEKRYRLDARPRIRAVAVHSAGALVFSAVHVSSMVALRKLVYALAGQTYVFDRMPFKVTTLTRARYRGVEGELPFEYWNKNEVLFADLQSAGERFATIDYSDGEKSPSVYIGEYYEFDELALSNLRAFEGW